MYSRYVYVHYRRVLIIYLVRVSSKVRSMFQITRSGLWNRTSLLLWVLNTSWTSYRPSGILYWGFCIRTGRWNVMRTSIGPTEIKPHRCCIVLYNTQHGGPKPSILHVQPSSSFSISRYRKSSRHEVHIFFCLSIFRWEQTLEIMICIHLSPFAPFLLFCEDFSC